MDPYAAEARQLKMQLEEARAIDDNELPKVPTLREKLDHDLGILELLHNDIYKEIGKLSMIITGFPAEEDAINEGQIRPDDGNIPTYLYKLKEEVLKAEKLRNMITSLVIEL